MCAQKMFHSVAFARIGGPGEFSSRVGTSVSASRVGNGYLRLVDHAHVQLVRFVGRTLTVSRLFEWIEVATPHSRDSPQLFYRYSLD